MDGRVLPLLEEFVRLITSLLAPGTGSHRARAEAMLERASELFGKLGAHRGQAAGEAVEEVQMLREAVMRALFEDPPRLRPGGWDLRNLLRLNRFVDIGVAHASVGHTDTLFADFIHGSGVADGPTDATLDEVRVQVRALGVELDELLGGERG